MRTTFWDSHGNAVAYLDDDRESVYLEDGTPVAWISGQVIYSYNGKLLGWIEEGWVFGPDGKCVLFTERAQPGAIRPFRHPPGARDDQQHRPSRRVPESPRKRPERLHVWSATTPRNFFQPS